MRKFKTNYKGVVVTITITKTTTHFDAEGINSIFCRNKDAQVVYKDLKLYIDKQVDKNVSFVKLNGEYLKVV